MASIDYLLARLPPLQPDLPVLPLGPEEFVDLIVDRELRFWSSGILDWLRLANDRSTQRSVPEPFPDVGSEPSAYYGADPWPEYYSRLASIHAPEIIRSWAREDAMIASERAAGAGRDLALQIRHTLDPRMQTLLASSPDSIDAAADQDEVLTRFSFQWLDDQVFGRARESRDRVYVYAIKLLHLMRVGRRVEGRAAA